MFSFKDDQPIDTFLTIMVPDNFDADTETDSDNEVQVLAVIPTPASVPSGDVPMMMLKYGVPAGNVVPVMTSKDGVPSGDVPVMRPKHGVPSGQFVPVPMSVGVPSMMSKHGVPTDVVPIPGLISVPSEDVAPVTMPKVSTRERRTVPESD